jgi:hypothetical protein
VVSRRRPKQPLTAAALAAELTQKRGEAVTVETREDNGMWWCSARAGEGRCLGISACYATEREALEALAGLCTCDARRGHALACAKVWGA